jgi:hypothetical protein
MGAEGGDSFDSVLTRATRPEKTDAGNGSYGIYRVIDGCQRPPGAALRVVFGKLRRSAPFPLAVA